MDRKLLDNVRVLDFTRVLAGPYATRLLADFGAEVIKVQSKKTANGAESNGMAYFNAWNRNKRSITLDLSFLEAQELVLRLTALSDLVIENFSPRVMSNWGLDYERLKKIKPDLVMVSLSGMGQTGPWKDFVALGPTLQALSGLTHLTSYEKDVSIGLGFAHTDAISGLYGAFLALAGLDYRDRTGQGIYIDISEYEVACSLMGPAILDALINGREAFPEGNRPGSINVSPHGCYRCAGTDRWCVIAVKDDDQWQDLCRVLGHPSWTREERFSTPARRKEHEKELDELLGEWMAQHTAEEAATLLQEAGVPAGVVQNGEDLAKDPQLMAREFFVALKHPTLGETISDRSPIKFREKPGMDWRAAPLLGQDNRYVFIELLGLTEKELSAYVENGVIG